MRFRAAVLTLAAVLGPVQLVAQQAAPTPPALDFSGTIFGAYWMRSDSQAKAQNGGKLQNRFDINRVYLTFRMPAGEKTSIRATTDIFPVAGIGWTVRLKYGYIQRRLSDNLFGVTGLGATARVGMLHTVVIDHEEQYWPRSLGTVALETNGFFSSADNGVASLFTLPANLGEAYVTITNGSGYTAAETDRFKDVAGRLTVTPLANYSSLVKSLAVSTWYYKGASASAFFNGGPGQMGPVTGGVQKDRLGLFVGLKDRRLTAGGEFAQRFEEIEGGANTAGSPRTVTDRTSRLTSIFALVRPMEFANKDKASRWGVLARMDQFKLDDSKAPGATFMVLGAWWDLSARSSITLDWQDLKPSGGSTTIPTRTVFLHWKADF